MVPGGSVEATVEIFFAESIMEKKSHSCSVVELLPHDRGVVSSSPARTGVVKKNDVRRIMTGVIFLCRIMAP
jgi:hypothetical protein